MKKNQMQLSKDKMLSPKEMKKVIGGALPWRYFCYINGVFKKCYKTSGGCFIGCTDGFSSGQCRAVQTSATCSGA
jgi:hypothetical protein